MKESIKERLKDNRLPIVIAIDGPSASGKGHIGRQLAALFNLEYVESSQVYRGLAYLLLKAGVQDDYINAASDFCKCDILAEVDGVDLSAEQIGQMASKIAELPEVRTVLTENLREIIRSHERVVMEGRDIGTVVVPAADLKLFLTADVNARAKRRYKQLQEKGKPCILSDVLEGLVERDRRDENRMVAPLKKAHDAIEIDATNLNPDQVIQEILDKME